MPSISSEKKEELLAQCLCVIYTPEDEHFGIVPLEAMAAGKPVLACNSGGPVESIVDGVTGILCAPVAEVSKAYCSFIHHRISCNILLMASVVFISQEFASAMQKVSEKPEVAARMGFLARLHVNNKFSRKAFGAQLDRHFEDLNGAQATRRITGDRLRNAAMIFWAFVVLAMTALLYF